ncbi:MAG TPA: hypothetical protein VHI13_18615 [Candidatus Kapabacteria bacterium]|nr:hypothetical protein [Candidatus Kapabacteria bacterium]
MNANLNAQPAPRKPGRPALSPAARREYAVCLLFTAAEWKQLRDYGRTAGVAARGVRGTLGVRLREIVLREVLGSGDGPEGKGGRSSGS